LMKQAEAHTRELQLEKQEVLKMADKVDQALTMAEAASASARELKRSSMREALKKTEASRRSETADPRPRAAASEKGRGVTPQATTTKQGREKVAMTASNGGKDRTVAAEKTVAVPLEEKQVMAPVAEKRSAVTKKLNVTRKDPPTAISVDVRQKETTRRNDAPQSATERVTSPADPSPGMRRRSASVASREQVIANLKAGGFFNHEARMWSLSTDGGTAASQDSPSVESSRSSPTVESPPARPKATTCLKADLPKEGPAQKTAPVQKAGCQKATKQKGAAGINATARAVVQAQQKQPPQGRRKAPVLDMGLTLTFFVLAALCGSQLLSLNIWS